MALQHTLTDNFGQILPDAYTRVWMVSKKEYGTISKRVPPLYEDVMDDEGNVIETKTLREETPEQFGWLNKVKIFADTFVNKEVCDSGKFPPIKSELVLDLEFSEYDETFTLKSAYEAAYAEISKKYENVINV